MFLQTWSLFFYISHPLYLNIDLIFVSHKDKKSNVLGWKNILKATKYSLI